MPASSTIVRGPILKAIAIATVLGVLLSGCGKPPRQSAKARLRVQGSQLATFNGCDRCHAETGYVLGPSWKQIAARYGGNPNAKRILIRSIQRGSSDKWRAMTHGQEMPPLGSRVSDEDIGIIVDYILSFSK